MVTIIIVMIMTTQVSDVCYRILGVIAMIDDDETDWKVLTIAMDDDRSQHPGCLKGVLKGIIGAWVETPPCQILYKSGPICCFPCKTITNTQKTIRFTIPEV